MSGKARVRRKMAPEEKKKLRNEIRNVIDEMLLGTEFTSNEFKRLIPAFMIPKEGSDAISQAIEAARKAGDCSSTDVSKHVNISYPSKKRGRKVIIKRELRKVYKRTSFRKKAFPVLKGASMKFRKAQKKYRLDCKLEETVSHFHRMKDLYGAAKVDYKLAMEEWMAGQ